MKGVNDAPFAVGPDGTVFVNVNHWQEMKRAEELLELALSEKGAVFIGVSLESHEVEHLLERLSDGAREAVAYVIGARLQGRRSR